MTSISLDDLAKDMTPACGHVMRLYVKLHRSGQPIQPSLDWTAELYGLNEKTVRRANAALVAAGLLTLTKVRAPGRPWSHNVYQLAGDLLAAAVACAQRIAAATARLAKDAAAEAIRAHRRLWHRAKRAKNVTPDILSSDLSFSVFQTKKETPTPGPTGRTTFLTRWQAGEIARPDMSKWRKSP